MERPSEVGKRFWSAVTAAAVARAAVQLARLTALDSPDLCPEGVLALRTAREKAAIPMTPTSDVDPGSTSPLQLFIRALDGSTLSLQLPASAGVTALRTAIEGRTGIPARELRLAFAGKAVVGDQLLVSLGIHSGAELQLMLSLRAARKRTRASLCGRTGCQQTGTWAVFPPRSLAPLRHHHPLRQDSFAGRRLHPQTPHLPA